MHTERRKLHNVSSIQRGFHVTYLLNKQDRKKLAQCLHFGFGINKTRCFIVFNNNY